MDALPARDHPGAVAGLVSRDSTARANCAEMVVHTAPSSPDGPRHRASDYPGDRHPNHRRTAGRPALPPNRRRELAAAATGGLAPEYRTRGWMPTTPPTPVTPLSRPPTHVDQISPPSRDQSGRKQPRGATLTPAPPAVNQSGPAATEQKEEAKMTTPIVIHTDSPPASNATGTG